MGAHYSSTAVRGVPWPEVEAQVSGWLARRGFVPAAAPLFPCEMELERGAYLFGNAEWTIVVFSQLDEERRLVRELMELGRPLLHLWLHDSDVWGYVLLAEGRTLAEFDSNPDYFHAGSGETFLGEPATGDLRSGAPAEICRVLGLPGLERDVAGLQGRSAVFKERIVHAFCDRIGIGPAASSFRYLEQGEAEKAWEGWTVRCLRYTKHGQAESDDANVDLHSEAAFRSTQSREPDSTARPTVPFEIPFQIRATMALLKLVFLPLGLLARMLAWIFAVRRRVGAAPSPPGSHLRRLPGHPPPPRVEGDHAISPHHGCRVRLPEKAELLDASRLWTRGGLWNVFAVRLADGLTVTCEARHPSELRDLTGRGKLLEDEKYEIGTLKARRRLVEFPSAAVASPVREEVHVVQMPRALYLWRAQGRVDATSRAAVRRLVESFEPLSQDSGSEP